MAWPPGRRRAAKYGHTHAKARAAAAARHHPTDPCVRCGHPLGPMGPWLHYDHDEHGGYYGFAHGAPCPYCRIRCNLAAGARKGSRIAHRKRRTSPLTW